MDGGIARRGGGPPSQRGATREDLARPELPRGGASPASGAARGECVALRCGVRAGCVDGAVSERDLGVLGLDVVVGDARVACPTPATGRGVATEAECGGKGRCFRPAPSTCLTLRAALAGTTRHSLSAAVLASLLRRLSSAAAASASVASDSVKEEHAASGMAWAAAAGPTLWRSAWTSLPLLFDFVPFAWRAATDEDEVGSGFSPISRKRSSMSLVSSSLSFRGAVSSCCRRARARPPPAEARATGAA
mmetsp:Transcript_5042/g.14315  ORF Transcript_5042/g.14315 Transcript_5042/m.14315 type:complete len:249 (-) Transcript_5042:338-1084(-)